MAIGSRIALDGEREFKKALSDINAGLRVTASELMLVTAKYSDNANSVQALTSKNEVLENRINSQTEKIAKLREALATSAREYGEADTKTMKWQVSLNKAETELVKMEKELQDNSKELTKAKLNMDKYGLSVDEVAESQGTFGDKLGGVIDGLGIHLPAGADKAIRSLDGTKASTAALLGAVVGLVAGFGKLTLDTAKTADEIQTLSSVTGLTTDTIQELRYASELVDVSAETITDSMAKMIRSMDDARKGTGDAADAFHRLHLRATDNYGQLKNSEQMFYEVVDALGQMRNETERDAAAMAIFGRSARELNPLIEAGSQKMKEYAEQAHAMGYVITPENIQRFANLDEKLQMFHNQLTAVAGVLAQAFLPILTIVFNVLNKIDPTVIAIGAAIGAIAITSFSVVRGIASMVAAWQMYNIATTTATASSAAFTAVSMKTVLIIAAVVAGVATLIAVIAILAGKYNEAKNAMNDLSGMSARSVTQAMNGLNSQAPTVKYSYKSGIDYVPSDRVALIHRGERVVPADENPYNPSATRSGGGDTYNYSINVKMDDVDDVSKLVRLFKELRQTTRAGSVMA